MERADIIGLVDRMFSQKSKRLEISLLFQNARKDGETEAAKEFYGKLLEADREFLVTKNALFQKILNV